MDILDKKQYNDASQLYLYTVHVIEEVNMGLENITPTNYAGAENGLYYHKGICIGARSPKINKNRPPSFLTEPLLKSNINGSHSFSFKMPRFYYDLSGNKVENNLITYLHNETRLLLQYYENIVDNQNFDESTYIEKTIELEDLFINNQVEQIDENIKTLVFVVKNITEDITGQFFEFECNDIYINELSKIGSQIVMDTELQNNIGTAEELATSVLEGSTWMYDNEKSIPIIQRTEGPVYEVITHKTIHALKQSPGNDTFVNIPANVKVLIFYDSIVGVIKNGGTNVPTQFLYAAGGYETDINDSLVINGDCYQVNINWSRNKNYLIGTSDLGTVFEIDLQAGISEKYRAARLVRSQRTEYDPLLERYVLLCKESTTGKEVYEILG